MSRNYPTVKCWGCNRKWGLHVEDGETETITHPCEVDWPLYTVTWEETHPVELLTVKEISE